MFSAIYDFICEFFDSLFRRKRGLHKIEPMSERDWLDYDDIIQRMFKAIKPKIRAFVDKTALAPTAKDIETIAKEETETFRWGNSYTETAICKKLGGYAKYWQSNMKRLEPLVEEYVNEYLNITKQREILATSVKAIVSAQMNAKGIEHTITTLKTQLKLEYKADQYRNRTVHIHYKKFMNDPDIEKYL